MRFEGQVDCRETRRSRRETTVDSPKSARAGDRVVTVIALLSVAPVGEESMSADVADAVAALDSFEVSYETNPMGTVIEADSVDQLLDAVAAAHAAVDGDRVSTVLKIDDKRTSDEPASRKVESVERHLGRPAESGDIGE